MKRRQAIVTVASAVLVPRVANAGVFAAPWLSQLARVAITVAFERFLIRPVAQQVMRSLPKALDTELSRYLFAVAVAFGLEKAQAEATALYAHQVSATELARHERDRAIAVTITNNDRQPLELPRVQLSLIDAATGEIERTSKRSFGVAVYPGDTTTIIVESKHYPNPGLKLWHLTHDGVVVGQSERFLVIEA
jgi:hypothetical protein